MLLPNKTIKYEQSVFPAMTVIAETLRQEPMNAVDLFLAVKNQVITSSMFQDALDALYALGAIRLEGDVISYAG